MNKNIQSFNITMHRLLQNFIIYEVCVIYFVTLIFLTDVRVEPPHELEVHHLPFQIHINFGTPIYIMN